MIFNSKNFDQSIKIRLRLLILVEINLTQITSLLQFKTTLF